MEIQKARPEDARFIALIAEAAYQPYVRRIGRKPAPMAADFAALIAAGEVWTLAEVAEIVGYVVLRETAGALHIENIAVHPTRHGEGYGRALMQFAEDEAERRTITRLDLYTNAAMRENIAFYGRLGWRELGRKVEDGFDRVYFGKTISGKAPSR